MADLGLKPLDSMLLEDNAAEQITYPRLYLRDQQAQAVPGDMEIGETRPMQAVVKLVSKTQESDGSTSVELEIQEATLPEKPAPTQGERIASMFYPTMGGK